MAIVIISLGVTIVCIFLAANALSLIDMVHRWMD
jgi:hypothetical protein